jgi:hypothetical protein
MKEKFFGKHDSDLVDVKKYTLKNKGIVFENNPF